MLSQENIDRLHMNGLYRCDPVLAWLPSYKRDNPYWCKNWTFRVKKYNDSYYMYDTYWRDCDESPIKLNDENFEKFEFLFDFDDVRYVNSYKHWIEYPEEDRWRVALDSGGTHNTKYVVKRNSQKM